MDGVGAAGSDGTAGKTVVTKQQNNEITKNKNERKEKIYRKQARSVTNFAISELP